MNTKLLSPSKRMRLKLKERVQAVRVALPSNWKTLYFFMNPEEKGQDDFVKNVVLGRSLHEPTIEKLEKLVQALRDKQLIS